jgi:fructose transport system permease protein
VTTTVAPPAPRGAEPEPSRLSLGNVLSSLGPLIALLLAIAYFSVKSDRFLTGNTLSLIVQQTAVVGVLAIGQTLVILTGGIDLSCGLIMAFGNIMVTRLAVVSGVNPYAAIAIALAVTTLFGLTNGLLVTTLRLPPFIVTLGMYSIAFALTRIYGHQQSVPNLPSELVWLGKTFKVGGTAVSYGSILMLALFVLAWYVLRQTAAGRHVYALGGNPEGARLSGIRTRRVLLCVYGTAGFLYGIAALLLVARTQVGDVNAGLTDNLESITAVVIGGTSLFGGRGTVIGTLIGALIVSVIRAGLTLTGVEPTYQVLITGILVIAAVGVDQFARRRSI